MLFPFFFFAIKADGAGLFQLKIHKDLFSQASVYSLVFTFLLIQGMSNEHAAFFSSNPAFTIHTWEFDSVAMNSSCWPLELKFRLGFNQVEVLCSQQI